MIELVGYLCFFLGAIIGCMIIKFIVKKVYKGRFIHLVSFIFICLICGFTMGDGDYVSGVLKGLYNYILPMTVLYFIDKINTKKAKITKK